MTTMSFSREYESAQEECRQLEHQTDQQESQTQLPLISLQMLHQVPFGKICFKWSKKCKRISFHLSSKSMQITQ
ncbi:hypothetical protein CEXT_738681 [Caerostris extrusa]|uniref:Uncharacterized protein n=1 Tax=Caerostris extrusa TaxID=172846 RepID=A0AAV4PKB2_CAEEX|nr:hypothetical protein CEXT_738681 [Caerostris extrusa]